MRAMRAVLVLLVLGFAGLLATHYLLEASARRDARDVLGSRADAAPQDAALGEFTPQEPPRPAPDLAFTSRDGTALRLADFRGRFILVNLWATWCGPCVREMPALDRLQARFGERLLVLAISEDRGGANAVDPFLEKLAPAHLAIFLDTSSAAQQAFRTRGLPTSYLIDRNGRVLGSLEGGAEWDSPEMGALIERYLRAGEGDGGIIKTSTGR